MVLLGTVLTRCDLYTSSSRTATCPSLPSPRRPSPLPPTHNVLDPLAGKERCRRARERCTGWSACQAELVSHDVCAGNDPRLLQLSRTGHLGCHVEHGGRGDAVGQRECCVAPVGIPASRSPSLPHSW